MTAKTQSTREERYETPEVLDIQPVTTVVKGDDEPDSQQGGDE